MGRQWGKADFAQLNALKQRMDKLEKTGFDRLCRQLANELAARLLAKVKKRTPVGVAPNEAAEDARQLYWAGYTGGALRDAWTILPIEKQGGNYVVTIVNHTPYASYVEYGHRQSPGRYVPALGKRLKAGWVKGRFMLTISLQELESQLPRVLEQKLYSTLKGVF